MPPENEEADSSLGIEDNWHSCCHVLRPPVLARLLPTPGPREPDRSWFKVAFLEASAGARTKLNFRRK